MALRGLRPGPLSLLRHPWRSIQLLLIPLIFTIVRSGDELAAAALVRGLGSPARPTSAVALRFGLQDAIVLAVPLVLAITAVLLRGASS